MSYYEQIGLDRSASVEAIRQAYRALAQKVHPDHHLDPHSRRLAELQMQRLNQIVETLSNPAKRLQYDLSLDGGRVPSDTRLIHYPIELTGPRKFWHWVVRNGVWGLTGMLAVICLLVLWLVPPSDVFDSGASGAAPPRVAQAAIRASKSGERHVSPINAIQNQETRLPIDRTQDVAPKIDELRDPVEASNDQVPVAPLPLPQTPSPASSVAPLETSLPSPEEGRRQTSHFETASRTPAPAKLAEAGFTGSWFFVPDPKRNEIFGLYPPEYIELLLAERDGVLAGRYRARYHVTDRAVFPGIAFQIEGRGAPGQSVRLGWKSPSGAKGEATLKLLEANSMEMNWWATTLSGNRELVSGTAVLIRRLVR